MPYADDTSVPVERSQAEMRRLLDGYKADAFTYAWDGEASREQVTFRIGGKFVKLAIQMPARTERRFTHTPKGSFQRTAPEVAKAWEREKRRRWRVLVLTLKAKLAAVDAGISTLEREFFADLMLPNGTTVSEWAAPKLAEAYRTGQMPELAPPKPTPHYDVDQDVLED